MLNIFTDNWGNPPVLNNGERMLHILTDHNPVNELYVIMGDSMDDDEVRDEIRFALRHKYGKHMEYGGFEDASYICVKAEEVNETADECWEGEGYYRIAWSDGGDWTNNGPVWLEYKDDLVAELEVAYQYKTDTHLPYAELVGTELFQEDGLDALLGDFKDDFDVEGIIEDLTGFDYNTGNRYWKNISDDKLNEILAKHDNSQ